MVCINCKTIKTEQGASVIIKEFIDPAGAFRCCDTQSGSRITFQPKYQVITTEPSKIKWMTMEQIYDVYPQFFKS